MVSGFVKFLVVEKKKKRFGYPLEAKAFSNEKNMSSRATYEELPS